MKITVSDRMVKVFTLFDIYEKYFESESRVTYEVSNRPQKVSVIDNNLRYLPFYMHWQFIVKHQWVYLSYRTLNLFKDSVKL